MQSALFIGRFQPFHNGHLQVIQKILQENERVIIVIGSAEKNFLPNDPMTAGERLQIIEEALKEAKIPCEKHLIIPIRNVNNYALWTQHLNIHLPPYTKLYTGSAIVKACFQGTQTETEIIDLERKLIISATEVRKALTNGENHWETLVPKACVKKIKQWNIAERLKIIQNTQDLSIHNNSY